MPAALYRSLGKKFPSLSCVGGHGGNIRKSLQRALPELLVIWTGQDVGARSKAVW